MKNFLIVILMVLIPMQAIAAAERNFTHVLGSAGQTAESVVNHIVAHAERVMHHHDDHDNVEAGEVDPHLDNSAESSKHIADFELSCGMTFFLPAVSDSSLPAIARIAPSWRYDAFSDRSTTPLLRPPRAFS